MGRFRCDDAPALIRAARADAGLTQLELARRAGLRQSSLAQMELGTRTVSARMLERVLRAADYRPSVPLAAHADEMDPDVQRQHIALYVNSFTRDLGDEGYGAITELLERAHAAGLVPPVGPLR